MAKKRAKRKYTRRTPTVTSPLDIQVAGDHYRNMQSQPISYILENDLGYVEGRVTEYMARWRKKGGPLDLQKARHLLDIAIEHYEKKGVAPNA